MGVKLRLSARNKLEGTIEELKTGVVNSEIVVKLKNGEHIVAMITKESTENMDLKVGSKVLAIIKASNVMIGVE